MLVIVATLDDIVQSQTSLDGADIAWLHSLVSDWQVVADLSFADLILWLPDSEEQGFWAGAHVRPSTGPTTVVEDVIANFVPVHRRPLLDDALRGGQAINEMVDETLRVDAIPVRRDDAAIAVIERRTRVRQERDQGDLETAYRQTAELLAAMIVSGGFPPTGERTDLADSMRVGDGFLRIDTEGRVEYASPNAMSAFTRIGHEADLVGAVLPDVIARVSGRVRAGDAGPVRIGSLATSQESEVTSSSGSIVARSLPLLDDGRRVGAAVLLRDVTELRRREQQLMSREATIREIHHRVKNNLQTVAALLRLQSRRLTSPEARAALDEAGTRIGSIAVVHEMLSYGDDETVDFDAVVDRLLSTVPEVAVAESGVTTHRSGMFGHLDGSVATPLAMVVTELIQNAVQHAFDERGGHIGLAVNRIRHRLRMRISDNGKGLPEGFDTGSTLGVSIVQALVETELGGTLTYSSSGRGTTVEIVLEVP